MKKIALGLMVYVNLLGFDDISFGMNLVESTTDSNRQVFIQTNNDFNISENVTAKLETSNKKATTEDKEKHTTTSRVNLENELMFKEPIYKDSLFVYQKLSYRKNDYLHIDDQTNVGAGIVHTDNIGMYGDHNITIDERIGIQNDTSHNYGITGLVGFKVKANSTINKIRMKFDYETNPTTGYLIVTNISDTMMVFTKSLGLKIELNSNFNRNKLFGTFRENTTSVALTYFY